LLNKIKIATKVPVSFFKEGNMFIAHSPVLDLSTCGNTFDEAKKNFEDALDIFIEECLSHNTLANALEMLGWKKQTNKWNPPIFVGQESIPFSIPVHA
jgi:predicted RNase H-like HicB family nuclease